MYLGWGLDINEMLILILKEAKDREVFQVNHSCLAQFSHDSLKKKHIFNSLIKLIHNWNIEGQ